MNQSLRTWRDYHKYCLGPDNVYLKNPGFPETKYDHPELDYHYLNISKFELFDVNIQHCGNNWGSVKYENPEPTPEVAQSIFPFFANTEFKTTQKYANKKLVINLGESWCYGGNIRDMNLDFTESEQSFTRALYYTMGAMMARLSLSDLHQFAYPGNNNVAMLRWLSHRLCDIITDYDDILVVVQHTEHMREFSGGNHEELDTCEALRDLIGSHGDDPWFDTHQEFNEYYWHHLWNWLAEIISNARTQTQKNIDVMVWSNFCQLPENIADRNFMWVPESWTQFNLNLEGGECPDTVFHSPGFVDVMKKHVKNPDLAFCEAEVDRIEAVRRWWINSNHRLGLHHQYPNKISHSLWASRIINQAGWLTYPHYAV